MKRFGKIFFVIFFCLTGNGFGQSITWQKLYGQSDKDDGAYDVCKTEDDNFFVVGSSGRTFSDARIYILKINRFGDTVWTKLYQAGHYAYSVTSTKDGGCAVTGYPLDSLFILKLDEFGEVEWQEIYPTGAICYDIQRTSDGGYLACGQNLFQAFLMKTDSLGKLIWKKNYASTSQIGFASCLEAIDNGYIAAGFVRDPDTLKIELLKVDVNGQTIWERRHKIYNNRAGCSSIERFEKGYWISGNSNGQIYFSRVTLDGYLSTICTLKASIGIESLTSSKVIEANRYVFSSTLYPGGDTMIAVRKICDSSGNVIYQNDIRTTGFISFQSIISINGYDLLFVGINKQNAGSNNDQVFLIRSDSTLYSKPLNLQTTNSQIPKYYELDQNFPNPFNPTTKIKFAIPHYANVAITIYSITGHLSYKLLNSNLQAGSYEVLFDANSKSGNFASGVYLYALSINNELVSTKKMILIR